MTAPATSSSAAVLGRRHQGRGGESVVWVDAPLLILSQLLKSNVGVVGRNFDLQRTYESRHLTQPMASKSFTSRGFPVRSPLSLIKEWQVAIAWTSGESNGKVEGSGVDSANTAFLLSTTPAKSNSSEVSVPV